MKVSQIGIIAVMLVVIAVALAGCTGSTPTTPATGGAAPSGTAASGSSSAAASAGPITAASIFSNMGYEWAEYKMVAGEGADKMTIYYKYNHKTGKCSMRFEMAQAIEGMPSEMDCSSAGTTGTSGQAAGNPNEVSPDVTVVKAGTESISVPAGTFIADKYTATTKDGSVTYWIVNGKPLIKMMGGSTDGSVVMELNAWG